MTLTLTSVSLVSFKEGIYKLQHSALQPSWTIEDKPRVYVNDAATFAIVKPQSPNLTVVEPGPLISLIEQKKLWGQNASVWLWAGGNSSNPLSVTLPIRCFQGAISGPADLAKGSPPSTWAPPGHGKRLVKVSGQLFFADGAGKLATSEAGRCFDPFTYVLAMFDIQSGALQYPSLTGQSLAAHLRAIDPAPIPSQGTWAQIYAAVTGKPPVAQPHMAVAVPGVRHPAPVPSPGAGMSSTPNLLLWNTTGAYWLARDFTDRLMVTGCGPTGYVSVPAKDWQAPMGVLNARKFGGHGVWALQTGQSGKVWGQSWQASV